ncbi:MAG: hypothetical protein WBW08_05630 [Methyloceanibacter sp.]|jgi:hypothetical protein
MRHRVVLAAVASLVLATGLAHAAPKQPPAGKLNTDTFLAACAADQNVTEMPGLEADSKVTPKSYCECVVGKLQESKLSQTDVDMLTKVHKDEVTDEDAKKYPTLEDLLSANEGFEDACKTSLGLPADDEDEEAPADDSAPPDEDAAPPE